MGRRDRGGFFKSVTLGRSVAGGAAPNLQASQTKSSDFVPVKTSTKVKFSAADPTVEYTSAVEDDEKGQVWYTLEDHEIFRDQIDETLNHLNELQWDESKMDDEEFCLRGLEEYFYNETPGYTLADYRKAAVKAVLKVQDQHRMQLSSGKGRRSKEPNYEKINQLAQDMADTLKSRNETSYERARKHANQDREDAEFIYKDDEGGAVEVVAVEAGAPPLQAETPQVEVTVSTSADSDKGEDGSAVAGKSLLRGSVMEKKPSQRYERGSLSYTQEQKNLLLDKLRADLVDNIDVPHKASGRPPISI